MRDNCDELCSQPRNAIDIPEELVDAIIIIGSLSQLPAEQLSCSKLKVVISILPHLGRNKNRRKRAPS